MVLVLPIKECKSFVGDILGERSHTRMVWFHFRLGKGQGIVSITIQIKKRILILSACSGKKNFRLQENTRVNLWKNFARKMAFLVIQKKHTCCQYTRVHILRKST